MEQGNMRPWLPFVIAGGIVASEGGSLFSLGAMFNFEWSTLLQSFNSSSVADLYRMLVFLFLIIGLFSMPSGLILLGIGLNKKQKWKGPAKAVLHSLQQPSWSQPSSHRQQLVTRHSHFPRVFPRQS